VTALGRVGVIRAVPTCLRPASPPFRLAALSS